MILILQMFLGYGFIFKTHLELGLLLTMNQCASATYNGSALDYAGKLLVLLRDGRKLMGTLRSFDQFGIHFSFMLRHL